MSTLSKKNSAAYSVRVKLPLIDELQHFKQPNVSPERYQVKDNLLRSTRYSKILVGGTSPKDGMIFNKNPGPGQYRESQGISDISQVKAKNQSSVFASTLGKYWHQSNIQSLGGSPRACAMAAPHSGEPYNEFGFFKAFNQKHSLQQDVHRVYAATKCWSVHADLAQGILSPHTKTGELLDFLRMNDRILRFKKRTVRNIEEAGQQYLAKRQTSKDGSQYI
jgi:hypothetical protein